MINVSTNDLKTQKMATKIAKATKDLVTFLKSNENFVTMSSIIPKLDELSNKPKKSSWSFKVQMFKEKNIPFLSKFDNIDPTEHLNEIKLQLNHHGIKVFAENFSKLLVKLNWCQQRETNLNLSVSLDLGTESHYCKTPSKEFRNFVENDDPSKMLIYLRLRNVNRLIYAQLNINS